METKFEVIFCIVNNGYSDVVMDVARQEIINANLPIRKIEMTKEEAEKFYGIVITPEKEIIMIIVEQEIKEKILHAIYEEAGLASPGQGIIFSLPISHVVGINNIEKN